MLKTLAAYAQTNKKRIFFESKSGGRTLPRTEKEYRVPYGCAAKVKPGVGGTNERTRTSEERLLGYIVNEEGSNDRPVIRAGQRAIIFLTSLGSVKVAVLGAENPISSLREYFIAGGI